MSSGRSGGLDGRNQKLPPNPRRRGADSRSPAAATFTLTAPTSIPIVILGSGMRICVWLDRHTHGTPSRCSPPPPPPPGGGGERGKKHPRAPQRPPPPWGTGGAPSPPPAP